MRFDARSAAVLQKASRGPAAIALRLSRAQRAAPISHASRILTGAAGPLTLSTGLGCLCGPSCGCGSTAGKLGSLGAVAKAVPAKWQVDPTTLRQLVAAANAAQKTAAAPAPSAVVVAPNAAAARMAAFQSFRGLGYLGLSPEAGAVTSKIASTAGGAAATAAAASGTFGTLLASSSLAGPIGLAAGIVIALAISLFTKKYFNVSQANDFCTQQVATWQKYLQIQGYVAGRALGWPTMVQIFHGAVGSGLFPGNDQHLQFHEGTLACAGNGTWADQNFCQTVDQMGGKVAPAPARNAICDALAVYNQRRSQIPAGYPDAVYFVDQVWLPLWAGAAIPWVPNGARNAQVHQLLYDVADAYLAQNTTGTTPYVEYPQSQVGTPTAGAAGLPAPSQLVPGQTSTTVSSQNMSAPGTPSYPVSGGSVVAGSGAGGNGFTTPSGTYYTPPGTSITPAGSAPAGYTGAATTGGSVVSSPILLYLGGGLLLAVAMLGLKHGKKGRRS